MAVRVDERSHWTFRKIVTLPDGTKSPRLSGVPTKYGFPDTKAGAEEAERIAVARWRESIDPGAAAAPVGGPGTAAAAPTRKQVPTVEEFAEVWLAKSAGDDKHSTIRLKKEDIEKRLVPRFGRRRLDQIDFSTVEAWRLDLLKTQMPSTTARLLKALRALLSYAVKLDVLERLPKWPQQKVPEQRPRFLTFAEADRLIAAANPMDPWKAMVIVAVRTGLRHGELTALRWVDIDFAGGRLSVAENYVHGVTGTPKSDEGREVPLSNDALRALLTIRHERGHLVFCTAHGRHLEPSHTDRALRRICVRAGLDPIGWHRLRHTFASHLAMRNVSLKTIQELMGHATLDMTMRYAHLMPEVRREAVLLLDRPAPTSALSGGPPSA